MCQRLCSVSLEFRQTFADLLRRWKTIWSFAEVAAKSCGKHPSNFRTRNTSILRQIPVLNSLVSHDRGGTGPELSPSPSRPVNSSAHRGGHVATESRSGRPALFLYNWTTRREEGGGFPFERLPPCAGFRGVYFRCALHVFFNSFSFEGAKCSARKNNGI